MSQDETRPSGAAAPTMAAVAAAVGAPEFLLPWLDRFYDGDDVEVLLAVARLSEADDEPAGLDDVEPERLERAVRRAVLDRNEAGAYAPASFHDRLEIWAMLEGWKDVPPSVHQELADWEVDHYTESLREGLEALKDGRSGDSDQAGYTYLLLAEGEEIIAAEERVYLWPCDCRAIVSRCRKPAYACLRFDNDRGIGWEISKERAVEILRMTDAAGLMHTDYLGRSERDPHAICNCCTDCCFPHLAAARLDAESVWPRRRYVAAVDRDECTQCGNCIGRCPFDAVTMSADEEPVVEAAECRGCGLCSTGCPAEAIAMRPLATPA